ncbi:MAG: organomercurial lyase MerB [Ktedonobacteraceae bacterium]
MHPTSLELLAGQLADGLRGEHDAFCRELVRLLASGHPVTRAQLATVFQMTVEQVAEVLAYLSDLEVDHRGNVVGWGLTLVPTPHRIQVHGKSLYTWCALDALTYPVLLHLPARVESSCPVSETEVSLSVAPTGICDLAPPGAVVSLVIPAQDQSYICDRNSFCAQGHFFRSRRDAAVWQGARPDGRILSVEDAYRLGKLVIRYRYESMTEHERTQESRSSSTLPFWFPERCR